MRDTALTQLRGIHFVEGAGHWVQQEEPEQVNQLIMEFLSKLK
jgi:pimeloyl-ACP methyl ester carboxylesterase